MIRAGLSNIGEFSSYFEIDTECGLGCDAIRLATDFESGADGVFSPRVETRSNEADRDRTFADIDERSTTVKPRTPYARPYRRGTPVAPTECG